MVEPEGVCTGAYARQDYVMLISRVLCVRGHYRAVSAGMMSCFLSGQSVKGVALCWCPDWERAMVCLQCLEARLWSELEVGSWSELECGWRP